MPIPDPETIGNWSSSQLAKYVQQILFDPQSLPSAMSLDALSVLGDMEVGGNALVNGVVKGFGGVATTVGPEFPVNPTPGQIHILQLDVSPFIHEAFVYDEKLLAWTNLTPKFAHGSSDITVSPPTDPNWSAAPASIIRLVIPYAKLFFDKGLEPQIQMALRMDMNTGGTGRIQGAIFEHNLNDSGITLVYGRSDSGSDFNNAAGTGGQYKASAWLGRNQLVTPTKTHWTVALRTQVSSGGAGNTMNIQEVMLGFRWVST